MSTEPTETATFVEVKTIAEVERIVHGSGLWDGTGEVEFSDDGASWTAAWTPESEGAHPQFARVSVYRKDVRIPTTITIRWDEQFPAASEEWAGKWLRSPMRHFGRTARMVGYRQTFREILGNIVIEDEADDRAPETSEPTRAADDAPARDWEADFLGAKTIDEIDALEAAARAARIFTPNAAGTALHRIARNQRKAIVEAAWAGDHAPAATEPTATDEATTAPAVERPAPRDYLPPQNRADRRASRRKKGRR
jgi:hypothetical protein